MPYTLSHTLTALPITLLTKHRIPMAALMVGSMSPDFPYLLALAPVNAPGHSLLGVLEYCVAPSLFVLALWYRWLERPLLNLLRLPRREIVFGVWAYCMILIGILLGAYSHVLWDATSHIDGVFVAGSEFWQHRFFGIPLFKWNQYTSGALGLLALAIWYLHAVLNNWQSAYKGHIRLGLSIHCVSLLFFVILANLIHQSKNLYEFAIHSSLGFISGGAVGMCLYALIVNAWCRKST